MLWTPGGADGDGVVTKYDHRQPGAFTEYGNQLPYLRELISTVVDLDRLNFVRLAKVQNSVGLPHRDLLELSDIPDDTRNAHRVHIPLATNENCFFSEGNTVYQMRRGEIWFLDASVIHSLAVLSTEARIHLMLDFANAPSEKPLITIPGHSVDAGIPEDRMVKRPPVTDADRASLLRLADVMTMETVDEIFSIVIKKHYRYDGGDDFVWSTMIDIAHASGDTEALRHIEELRRYFTIERSPYT
ncbi:aspartyl/asparaginyl beta-hydroxylase domain-containing protein [Catellatospora sichuanensis]|uniref:aspartyl/asparaginyl beta-hydroxylase domain-containing protein n=1 Tax=Catellatospora sichuanensis TaxID=1969805 RepID=UPI001C901BE1|nr:aspartyl/asparaginyl beta-hydroxylase domain-containing protein [Catellatospora sichuanensis]